VRVGFLIFNAGLVAFELWCWVVPMQQGWRAARGLAWFWILLECGNGAGHLLLALNAGGYFPGEATAPQLLVFAVWLARYFVTPKSSIWTSSKWFTRMP